MEKKVYTKEFKLGAARMVVDEGKIRAPDSRRARDVSRTDAQRRSPDGRERVGNDSSR